MFTRSTLIVAGLLSVLSAAPGGAVAQDFILACIDKTTGAFRKVESQDACTANETLTFWSRREGPDAPGAPGSRPFQGIQGQQELQGEPAEAGGPHLVLSDSANPPKQVGHVLGVATRRGFAPQKMVETVMAFKDSAGIERSVLFRVSKTGINEAALNLQPRLFFATATCTGRAWFESYVGQDTAFTELLGIAQVVWQGAARKLYGQVGDVAETFTGGSWLKVDGTCETKNAGSVTGYRAEVLDPDLHETFPPPYTLELR